MLLPQITWQEIQEQTPDDGRRREAIGREETEQARFTDRLPVRLRGDVLGEIDLGEVFRRA